MTVTLAGHAAERWWPQRCTADRRTAGDSGVHLALQPVSCARADNKKMNAVDIGS